MQKLKIFLITLLASILLISCSDMQDSNKLIVATSADNPPYEFMQDGEIVGFDIDFINAVSKELGKEIEIKNMEFHSLIAALASNNIDAVIAGMSITPERAKRVDFSIPYAGAKIAVLYRKCDDFTAPSDLKDKKVGAQLGTIWNMLAHDLSIEIDFDIQSLASNLMLVEELKNMRIDAVVVEQSQAAKFSEAHSVLGNFPIDNMSSSFAIALPKNSQVKRDIDKAIKTLKDNGTMARLAKKWGINGTN